MPGLSPGAGPAGAVCLIGKARTGSQTMTCGHGQSGQSEYDGHGIRFPHNEVVWFGIVKRLRAADPIPCFTS